MILEEMATRIEGIVGITYARPPVAPNNLFLRHLPDAPDVAMAVYATGGRGATRTMDNKLIDHFRVMIWSRATTGAAAEAALWAVYKDLHDIQNATVGGKRWLAALPVQPPFLMERDENRRFTYSMNVDVMREGES